MHTGWCLAEMKLPKLGLPATNGRVCPCWSFNPPTEVPDFLSPNRSWPVSWKDPPCRTSWCGTSLPSASVVSNVYFLNVMIWLVGLSFPTCWNKIPGRTKYLIERACCLRIMDAELPWTENFALVLLYDNLFCQNFGFSSCNLTCKVGRRPPHWSLIRYRGRSRNGSLVLWFRSDIKKRYSRPWLLLD